MNKRYLLVVLMMLPATLWAQSARDDSSSSSSSSSTDASGQPFGAQTQAWVDLQVSGRESTHHKPALSGDVATHIYDRYLKSFDHPIPDTFSREKFVQGGGSGGK